jgi:hypothetical protein
MNGKMKVVLVGFAAAVILAIAPAAALAGEPVLDPTKGDVTFTGSGEVFLYTFYLGNITCEQADASGTINTEGKSGSMVLDVTGCHIYYMGFTYPCKSASAPLSNTVRLAGSFETTYLTDGNTKPGIKFTIPPTQVICGVINVGFTTLSGSTLGTLSSPACGAESGKGTIDFKVVGALPPKEEHRQITGTGAFIEWISSPGPERESPAGLGADLAIEFSESVTLTCV